jgi:hypothetical protein
MKKKSNSAFAINMVILTYYFGIVTVKPIAALMNKFYLENVAWIDTFSPIEIYYVIFLLIFPMAFYLMAYFLKKETNRAQKLLINLGPPVLLFYLFLL